MAKILVLSSFPAPYRTGVFKGLSEIYDTDVFFATDQDQNRSKDYFDKKEKFHYYVITDKADRIYFEKCTRHLEKYDLVLAYDWYLPYAIKVEFACIVKKIPYIINCDGAFLSSKRGIKDIVKGFFVSHASLCFAGGEFAKKYFLHYGAKESQITIHRFTSLHRENIIPAVIPDSKKKEIRKALGLCDKLTVLSVGQFIYRKGFDILLEAWKKIEPTEKQLVIIGGGDLRSEYERFLLKNNIENVVILDFVPFDQILLYYQASDVFALATREDVWGLIVNEAMANGLPVVISENCVAGQELIVHQENGIIVDNNSVKNWADALRSILGNKCLRDRFAERSLKTIRDWTIENVIEQHICDIDRLLN